jgi:hypothetical protein
VEPHPIVKATLRVRLPQAVLGSSLRSRLSLLSPLVLAPISLIVFAVASRRLDWLWIAWFDWFEEPYFAPLAAQWISVFVSSVVIYYCVLAPLTLSACLKTYPSIEWVRSFFAFMILLSCFLALHFSILVTVMSGQRGAPGLWEERYLLLVAGLAAFLWPTAFHKRIDVRTVSSILVLTLLALGLGLVLLEPLVFVGWRIALGLHPPVMQGYFPGPPMEKLLYLVSIGPVLWSVLHRWRENGRAA